MTLNSIESLFTESSKHLLKDLKSHN